MTSCRTATSSSCSTDHPPGGREPYAPAMTRERARAVHLVVAVVAWFALVLQLVLVLQGAAVLVDEAPARPGGADLPLLRLLHDPEQHPRRRHLDRARPRPGRVTARVGGSPAWPRSSASPSPASSTSSCCGRCSTSTGADWSADKLLHMVVPVLAVAAWALAGPRPRSACARRRTPSPGRWHGWAGRSWSARSTAGCPTRSSTPARRAGERSGSPVPGSPCSSSCSSRSTRGSTGGCHPAPR